MNKHCSLTQLCWPHGSCYLFHLLKYPTETPWPAPGTLGCWWLGSSRTSSAIGTKDWWMQEIGTRQEMGLQGTRNQGRFSWAGRKIGKWHQESHQKTLNIYISMLSGKYQTRWSLEPGWRLSVCPSDSSWSRFQHRCRDYPHPPQSDKGVGCLTLLMIGSLPWQKIYTIRQENPY